MRRTGCLALVLFVVGCVDDPRDPKTWVKKLGDPREGKAALSQLVKLKDPAAVEPLIEHFKKTKDPDVLKALAAHKDKRQVPVMADALDYTEESCDLAKIAANALGETPDAAAVDPLMKAAQKPLPIKSNCNIVRLEAMKALAKIKDKKATPALVKVLETPADDQDFFLNKTAAVALGDIADPAAVPALVRGLFMTGRGTDIFQECRSALLAIGEPAVDPLIEAMQRKNAKLEEDAKKYEFLPGIIVQKTSILLGDLRAKKAVAALIGELNKKDEGLAAGAGKGVSGHQSVILALGQIAGPEAQKAVMGVADDAKRPPKHKAAAAEALNLAGDPAALPTLLRLAQTKFLSGTTIDPEPASVMAAGTTAHSRLAWAEQADAGYQKVPEEIMDIYEVVVSAQKRLEAAKECKKDMACWVKLLNGKDNIKAEKAALMVPRVDAKAGLAELAKQVGHIDPSVRASVLFGLGQYGDASCKACLEALDKQIDIDRTKRPLKGLVDEMIATRAFLSGRAAK
jgi:HEAT repeat protein